MEYNLITNIKDCYIEIPNLLYYSHIPTAIISLLVGFFVFFKNRQNLSAKILFLISIVFSTWSLFDIILWVGHDSRSIMFFWAMWGILFSLLFFLSFYFIYVFIKKVDAPLVSKMVAAAFFIPVLFLTPTVYNLKGFEIVSCGALESNVLLNYVYSLAAIVFLSILVFSIIEYRKTQGEFKKQIFLSTLGVLCFLLVFFFVTYVASLESLFNSTVYSFTMEQYGYFGMPIFMAFLAYLIVKYKAFNIKLLGAQALVVTLFVLIGSQFFFIQNNTNRILTGITLLLSAVFGWFLIKSVKLEVQRKEELQMMSTKLAQANDQLRKLDNSKSEFISIASHQLRTPLTAIKGFVSLLLEGSYGKLMDKQEEALNKTYTSTERLINLVEDLLNVSRMESGRMEFKFAPAKMEDLCQEIIDTFVLRAKEKDLYLNYKNPETPMPELMIDAGKVKEVVSNMVDNALKYSPKGGVTLRLERRENPNSPAESGSRQGGGKTQNPNGLSGEVVRVTVSDTGIGIPATELPYLFSKFSRGKDVGRLNTGGTGLGLYVGKGMIENNGGRIWAESDGEGKGSRFIIELPVKQSDELLQRWG